MYVVCVYLSNTHTHRHTFKHAPTRAITCLVAVLSVSMAEFESLKYVAVNICRERERVCVCVCVCVKMRGVWGIISITLASFYLFFSWSFASTVFLCLPFRIAKAVLEEELVAKSKQLVQVGSHTHTHTHSLSLSLSLARERSSTSRKFFRFNKFSASFSFLICTSLSSHQAEAEITCLRVQLERERILRHEVRGRHIFIDMFIYWSNLD